MYTDLPTYPRGLSKPASLSIRSRSFLRAGSRCASRIDPDDAACRIQILDSDSGLTVVAGSRELGKSHGMRGMYARYASLFFPRDTKSMGVSKISVRAFNL